MRHLHYKHCYGELTEGKQKVNKHSISYVMDSKGTDLISIHDNRYMSDVKFTDEEWQILEKYLKRLITQMVYNALV